MDCSYFITSFLIPTGQIGTVQDKFGHLFLPIQI